MDDLANIDADAIEGMIDRFGLSATLETIADIAREKSDHIESNWQDPNLARSWNRIANRIDRTAAAAAREVA